MKEFPVSFPHSMVFSVILIHSYSSVNYLIILCFISRSNINYITDDFSLIICWYSSESIIVSSKIHQCSVTINFENKINIWKFIHHRTCTYNLIMHKLIMHNKNLQKTLNNWKRQHRWMSLNSVDTIQSKQENCLFYGHR